MKKIFKSKVFILIIFIFVFGVISVSAVTYFPSNDVTYNNETSGLKSTDVQGAIDELYTTCQMASQGSSQSVDSIKANVVTSGDGLYKDSYESGRYFFKGANPNNYIIFNNSEWRIISIESDGTIKILMNFYTGTSANDYYNYISPIYKSLIVSKQFSYGDIKPSNTNLVAQIKDENSRKRTTNIDSLNVSEFIRSNSNVAKCGNLSLIGNSTCRGTTYMDTESTWPFGREHGCIWFANYDATESPDDTYHYDYQFAVDLNSTRVKSLWQMNNCYARYAVYLKPGLTFSGTGSRDDPYIINID